MASIHRKLLPKPKLKPKDDFPDESQDTARHLICETVCIKNDSSHCIRRCLVTPKDLSPPPPPPIYNRQISRPDHSNSTDWRSSAFAVSAISSLSFLIVAIPCLLLIKKYINRGRNPSGEEGNWPTLDDETDDDGVGPTRYYAWDIQTLGLEQSAIDSIAVFKYKAGDGLIEGTECSVCLSEFEEAESLRLLPKCRHAFHLPCIDRWLAAHRNCPLCRAPVVVDSKADDSGPSSSDSGSIGEIQIENSEDRGGDDGVGSESNDFSAREEEQSRRSISIDFDCALDSDQFGDAGLRPPKKRRNGHKLRKSSSLGRSLQMGSVSMKRSYSSGRLLFVSREKRRLRASSTLAL